MATFSKAVFNSASYASFRPTYPKSLYDAVYKYHAASPTGFGHAIDLGCGTGQATIILSERFNSVTGVDPSPGMISTARKSTTENKRVSFEQSGAEELSFAGNQTADLVTAAQAAHWFDYDRLWPELARVLKKGGTVALWNYSEFRLSNHPRLTSDITTYASDPTNPLGLGKYWEQPGRSILDNHLQAIKYPTSSEWDVANAKRIYFVGNQYPCVPAAGHPTSASASNDTKTNEDKTIYLEANDLHEDVILKKTLTWEGVEGYLRTFSPLVAFKEAHPNDKDSPEGDVVSRFVKKLKEGVTNDLGGSDAGNEVQLEWPMVLLLISKAR